VSDAEALRKALGVERWLLFGESYGTTVAAHDVATYPRSIAAAVLDSLYPADDFVLPTAEMQGRLVDRVAGECAQDAACAARWPDFGRAQLGAAVAALDAKPLAIGRDNQRRLLNGLALRPLVMITASSVAGSRRPPRSPGPRATPKQRADLLLGPFGAQCLLSLQAEADRIDFAGRDVHRHISAPGVAARDRIGGQRNF
jgi:pimeloyl-ACP methyl ester carboxylesterase